MGKAQGPKGEISSRSEITWINSADASASFDSEAAAVGIGGTAGAVGISRAVGRDQPGSFRLFGLFSLSRSLPGDQRKQRSGAAWNVECPRLFLPPGYY
jgi:hypothetical protein